MRETKESNVIVKYGKACDYYKHNLSVRETLEQTWRDCAQLTLPYIFPPDNQNNSNSDTQILPTPYNSIGPDVVNTLAAKLLLTLLPPTGVFFRLLPLREKIIEMDKEQIEKLDGALSQTEQDIIEMINLQGIRVPTVEALKLLIITGNAMMYKIPNKAYKTFSPYQYVVQRDYIGNLLSACIEEKMDIKTLPESVQKIVEDEQTDRETTTDKHQVAIYTMILREDNKYIVWQEVSGKVIPGTFKRYKDIESLPYIILRWNTTNNEDYGRGLVEQYLGDLRSLEALSQIILEGAGIMSKVLFGLRPGSTTRVEDMNNAENGDFVLGDLEREVSTLKVDKNGDFQIPFQLMQRLETRISKAFMQMSGQVRDSERTTATEVRATAAELESTLGGVFSILSADFQKPTITYLLNELNPKVLQIAAPSVTTGISAISREKDFNNLNTMSQTIQQFGPEAVAKYMKLGGVFSQIATSLGMDPSTVVNSEAEIAEKEKQMMQMQQQMQQQQTQEQMAIDQNKEQVKGE